MGASPQLDILFRGALGLGLLAVTACSGGGDGAGGGSPVLLRVVAGGVAQPLWQGSSVGPPLCGGPVFQNSPIILEFAGPVDRASLPSGALLQGSITLADAQGAPVAMAAVVEDDPSLPAGNRRRVAIRPPIPTGSVSTGFAGATLHSLQVQGAGGSGSPVIVAGLPLATTAVTCFSVCDPGVGGPCNFDPHPGAPLVAASVPATGEPPPPAVPVCPAAPFVLSVEFTEPLDPQGIGLESVRLVLVANGAQVPGSVSFSQPPGGSGAPGGTRVEYRPAEPLLPGQTYELLLSTSLRDLAGNPLRLEPLGPGGPGSRRLFATEPGTPASLAPIVEEFDTTLHRATAAGLAQWTGNGALTVPDIGAIIGNGAFGPLLVPAGPSTLDAGAPPASVGGLVAFADGVWNTTSVTIAAGALVRLVGHSTAPANVRRVHFRSTGGVAIQGVLNANAGTNLNAPPGDPEQGPRPGRESNGIQGGGPVVLGGVGGVGAGSGGAASQEDPLPGPAIRTAEGQAGFGAPDMLALNPGSSPSLPHFGGGQGGQGGFLFPSGGVAGELGGLGGAGGSAFGAGEDGGPFSPGPVCTTAPVSPQLRARASGTPPVFQPPISIASAGSGGGGGGDRFETAGPTADDQGGGGGGGGGGIRITAFGDVSFDPLSQVLCSGASGAQGSVFFGGAGGGGSGGEIWVQCAGQIIVSSGAALQVNGGSGGSACSNQGSGAGGVGLYQFEDTDGFVNTSFLGTTGSGANIAVLQAPFGIPGFGFAMSTFYDSGTMLPEFGPVQESLVPSVVPGAGFVISWQGAHALPSGNGPDFTTVTSAWPSSHLAMLNGHRYLRFLVSVTFPLLPPPPAGALLPGVDRLAVPVSAPVCP